MKRGFWWRKQGPSPLFPRQTRVRIHGAAMGGIISIWILYGNAPWQFFVPARRFPTWFRWRRSGRKAESESGGDGLLANPRIVARRRFQPFGRRHRNRSGGFCCFSPPKSREREKSFFLVLLGPKVPKASARRFPRESTARGAARGAQDQAYAPPRDGRVAARTLFLRVKRECGFVVPPWAALFYLATHLDFIWQRTSISITSSSPAWRVPTGFRWRESGRRAESESGGDGLLANPRSRPTPLSAFRTPTSESVGWLLLLFATEKQRKRKEFLSCTFGAKSTKSLRTSFSAGEHGPRRCTGRARSGLCATP